MGDLDNSHYRDALEAIHSLDRAGSIKDVAAIVSAAVAPYGYRHFCCGVPLTLRHKHFDACLLMVSWPAEWADLYSRSHFYKHDPVIQHTRQQLKSTHWSDVPPSDDPVARSIMAIAASDFGLRAGMSVPIIGIQGYQAGLSFAGSAIDTSAHASAVVELVAIFAFNRISRLRQESHGEGRVLTDRQREIISWAAAGKTAWDTSQILGVSEDNVNKIIASAMTRLNASNRTHAVVEAIRRKEIEI